MRRLLLLVLVHLSLACSSVWSQDITTGLTVWYKFDDGSGTTAADSSGNTRTGVLQNGAAFTATGCKINGCLAAFDGNDDQVATGLAGSTFLTASAGTLALWYKPLGTSTTQSQPYQLPAIVAEGGGYYGLFKGIVGGTDAIWAYNYDGSVDQVFTTFVTGTWMHLAWVHGGGTLSLYKDGTLANSVASGNTGSLTSLLTIGAGLGLIGVGQVDEFRAYNRALTAADVTALFNYGLGAVRHRYLVQ